MACPRGGEIVDYVLGWCSCGQCPARPRVVQSVVATSCEPNTATSSVPPQPPSNLPRFLVRVRRDNHGHMATDALVVEHGRFLLLVVFGEEALVRELTIDAPKDTRLHGAWTNDRLTAASPDGLDTSLWSSEGERQGFVRNIFGGQTYPAGTTFTFEFSMREAGMLRLCLECDDPPVRPDDLDDASELEPPQEWH